MLLDAHYMPIGRNSTVNTLPGAFLMICAYLRPPAPEYSLIRPHDLEKTNSVNVFVQLSHPEARLKMCANKIVQRLAAS